MSISIVVSIYLFIRYQKKSVECSSSDGTYPKIFYGKNYISWALLVSYTKVPLYLHNWIFANYTERRKKLITSSEWRSLKSTSLKWIIFGHRFAIVLLKDIWKIKGLLLSKRRKMQWNCKRKFFKNHRNCSLRTSTKGRLFRTFNTLFIQFQRRIM